MTWLDGDLLYCKYSDVHQSLRLHCYKYKLTKWAIDKFTVGLLQLQTAKACIICHARRLQLKSSPTLNIFTVQSPAKTFSIFHIP